MSKGDKWRETNYKNYFTNFDNIKFAKKNKNSETKKIEVKKNKTTNKK